VVAAFGAACVALAVLYLAFATPVYRAEAKITVRRESPRFIDMKSLLSEKVGNDSDFYRTQRVVLLGHALAREAIRSLDFESHPHLAQKEGSGGLLAGGLAALRGMFKYELPDVASALPDVAAAPSDVPPAVLARYRAGLEVTAPLRTHMMTVAFTSPDPELSRRAVEAHLQAFVRQGIRLRNEASHEAQRFLERKLVELKQRLEISEVALNAYRRDTGMVSLDGNENIVVDRLATLNDLLAQAEAVRIKREAEVRGGDRGDPSAIPEVAQNPLIQALEHELGTLEADYVSLSAQFKPTYPAVKSARARLEEMQHRLDAEVQRIVGTLQSAYLMAVEEENRLREQLETQKGKALELKDASVRYAILKRETDSHRGLYESILDRVKELGIAATAQSSNVSIVEPPVTPSQPSSPKPLALMLLALVGGLGSGVAFVLGRDAIDSSLDTPEEVEQLLRVPSLGVIPDLAKLPTNKDKRVRAPDANTLVADDVRLPSLPAEAPHRLSAEAVAVLAEAYRTFRTGILFSRADSPPKVLLLSSALPFEGKTTTVLNLAIAFHEQGKRVLVIDADLRMPKCHNGLRLEQGEGLTEILTGQRQTSEVIQQTYRDGLDLISAGTRPPNPTELLGSKAMVAVLEQAARDYDHVLIDTPPVMAVSDAVVLAPQVEGTVLVLKAHSTPRQVVERAEARLRRARAKLLGVLFNGFDARQDSYATSYGGKYYAPYYGAEDASGQ
jgi:capsular exopolysaccharide synthesis family protein